jgi:hypothetical protein
MLKILRAEVKGRKEYVENDQPYDRACYIALAYASAGRKVRKSITIGVSNVIE